MSRAGPRRVRRAAQYALANPHRCSYTLFSRSETITLAASIVGLNLLALVFFLASSMHLYCDRVEPDACLLAREPSRAQVAVMGFFQVVNTRATGLQARRRPPARRPPRPREPSFFSAPGWPLSFKNPEPNSLTHTPTHTPQVFDIKMLSPVMSVLFAFMMWFAATPFVSVLIDARAAQRAPCAAGASAPRPVLAPWLPPSAKHACAACPRAPAGKAKAKGTEDPHVAAGAGKFFLAATQSRKEQRASRRPVVHAIYTRYLTRHMPYLLVAFIAITCAEQKRLFRKPVRRPPGFEQRLRRSAAPSHPTPTTLLSRRRNFRGRRRRRAPGGRSRCRSSTSSSSCCLPTAQTA